MKYSIIIPCYKQEHLVTHTLDSVLCQKVRDWEILCTDDGSPDRTGEVLDEYVKGHCRDIKTYYIQQNGEKKRVLEGVVASGGVIKVIHQANKGMSGARNTAKQLAVGEWFIYVDGDDLLAPNAFEILENCIARCPDADMLCGGIVYFNDWATPKWDVGHPLPIVVKTMDKIDSSHFPNDFQQMVCNRRICGDILISGPNWSEERLYSSKCIARTKKHVSTPAVFYARRKHEGQFTAIGKMTLAECNGYLDATMEILRIFHDSGRGVMPSTTRGLLLLCIEGQLNAIMYCLRERADRKKAWEYWFKSLPTISRYPMTLWIRFVTTICRILPFVPVALVFCYCPYWLKRKGLHR